MVAVRPNWKTVTHWNGWAVSSGVSMPSVQSAITSIVLSSTSKHSADEEGEGEVDVRAVDRCDEHRTGVGDVLGPHHARAEHQARQPRDQACRQAVDQRLAVVQSED